ncbi:MAG: glycosyltransferase [Candidatus Bathyarchaeia archaeon]|jgi:glycosyltransferase involved in cell wall biosynthesis
MKPVEIGELPFVSIVVCTYNRKKLLKDCLNSIFSADYPSSLYEVIIVDGGSTDGTKELCKAFPKIRFIIESKFGLAHARNKGASLARGSVVAYVDDDCVVDKFWLKNLLKGFQYSKSVVGVGGPVFPLHPELIPPKIFVLAPLGFYDEGRAIKLVSGIVMPNSAFRRQIFETIQFDETLGVTKRGKLILLGEDTEFCRNIINSGYQLLYTPYAKVYHQMIMERLTVRYIIEHSFGNGIVTAKSILKQKNSRIWAVRIASGGVAQAFFASFSRRSFTSCYMLVAAVSTLLMSITSLDEVLVPSPKH